MDTTECRRLPLARGEFARVDLCDCGGVHLTIGAVTLRLSPLALASLAEVITDAALHHTLLEINGRRAEALS
jgi:hypothetical protein